MIMRTLPEDYRHNDDFQQPDPRGGRRAENSTTPWHGKTEWSTLIHDLFALQYDTGADGKPKAALVRLSDDARGLFREYVNKTGIEQAGLTGDLSAAWSKLEECPARLGLVLHCVRQAVGETVDPWLCDVETMESSIILAGWFKDEIQRVYRLLTQSPEDRDLQQLAEWIEQRGGTVRVRDLVAGRRDLSDAEQAEKLLHGLVAAGYGEWRRIMTTERGGRPTMEFSLYAAVAVD